MAAGLGDFAIAGEMLGVLVGKRHLVEAAADDGLWLFSLGHGDRLETGIHLGDVDEAAEEVDEVRALQQQLRHPGVVVVAAGEVAVGAGLRFPLAHAMRKMRIKRLPAVAFG